MRVLGAHPRFLHTQPFCLLQHRARLYPLHRALHALSGVSGLSLPHSGHAAQPQDRALPSLAPYTRSVCCVDATGK